MCRCKQAISIYCVAASNKHRYLKSRSLATSNLLHSIYNLDSVEALGVHISVNKQLYLFLGCK